MKTKIGDVVWVINPCTFNDETPTKPMQATVTGTSSGFMGGIFVDVDRVLGGTSTFYWGETAFASKEEAIKGNEAVRERLIQELTTQKEEIDGRIEALKSLNII